LIFDVEFSICGKNKVFFIQIFIIFATETKESGHQYLIS